MSVSMASSDFSSGADEPPNGPTQSTAAPKLQYPLLLDMPGSGADKVNVFLMAEGFRSACAAVDLPKGQAIGQFTGTRHPSPNLFTLNIGDDLHILETGPLVTLNHACRPNCAFVWPESAYRPLEARTLPVEKRFPTVVALRDIKMGEHLTFNYTTTEWQLSSPFRCECKAHDCVGEVLGYRFLPHHKRAELAPIVSPHISRMAKRDVAQLNFLPLQDPSGMFNRALYNHKPAQMNLPTQTRVSGLLGMASLLPLIPVMARFPAQSFGFARPGRSIMARSASASAFAVRHKRIQ